MKCPKCNFENPADTKFCGECAAPLHPSEEISAPLTETLETPTEELTTGSTFAGRYQIIEELGKGGMGKVYKAQDTDLKEKVAIKLLRPEIAADKKTIERFRNELKFARKIRHKNVCQMYDLNKEAGLHYITMEYVDGKDLKSMIRMMGQLSSGKTIFIAKQVCEGLVEAHRLGIVHRDLKPQNIMVDEDGNARIMDFGIARSLKTKGITAAGVMIGTPEYMSPEQVEGKEVDQRSDIYSLGVILYEMVTGRVPFEGDTPFTIGVKHKSEMPKDPKELNTQLPEDLNLVILRCLEKDKEKRYQSAGEVRAELTRIEKGIPTTEIEIPKRKPITSREITVTFGLKKLFIPALVVVALVIVALVIWQLLLQKQPVSLPPEKPSIAVLPFEDLSPLKDQEHLCLGIAAELIHRLTKVQNLRVPARASSFSFRGEKIDIQEVGSKLDVKTVLMGTLQKAAKKLRISVELINVDDNNIIWSDKYERDEGDIFDLQDEVTLSIVDKLKVNLFGEERAALVKRYTENVEAYNLYLNGRFFWNKRSEEGLRKAIEKFELALKLDPNYSLALVGISDCYNLFPIYAYSSPKEAFPKAKEAVLKALQIDNSLAEAHTSLAWIKLNYDWDWKGAEKEFKQAIDLNPGYATAHHWYSVYLNWMGRTDEAIKEIEIALELDPVSLVIKKDEATPYSFNRQYDKAIEILQNTIEMDPNFPGPHAELGHVYLSRSMYKKALKAYKEEKNIMKDWNGEVEAAIGTTYVKMGMKDEALQVLDDLIEHSKHEYVPPLNLALLYFNLGEKILYQNSLDKAFEERDFWIVLLKKSPGFENLRSDKACIDLLKKVNLLEE